MTDGSMQAMADRIDDFVAGWAGGRERLHAATAFPDEIWQRLADCGLLGLALPTACGGLGGDYRMLAAAARRMSAAGGVMGVTLTWLSHNLNARLHLLGRGTAAQKAAWLSRIARGQSSLAVAISEPGAGAHPKHLKTRARRDGADYVIDGEKAYLTNGPLADLFLVLAVTSENEGRKAFSAIIVPRDTPGFRQTAGVAIDFLHPAAHCGIELVGCRVPAENVLGEVDAGFAEISLPMRAVEDALAASNLAGAFEAQLGFLGAGLGADLDKDGLADFGQLLGKADALAALAAKLAAHLDADAAHPERLNGVSAGFRRFAGDLQADIDSFVAARGIVLSPTAERLRYDLEKSLGIAGLAQRLQGAKRAQAFLQEREQS